CRVIDADGPTDVLVAYGTTEQRHRAPAVAWHGDQGLLVWTVEGELRGVWLDNALRPTGDTGLLAAEEVTARQPSVIAGHGKFLVVYQDALHQLQSVLVGPDSQVTQALPDGFEHVMPAGVAVAPDGFVVSAIGKDTVFALLSPDLATVTSPPQAKQRKVRLDRFGMLDLTLAHDEGRLVWSPLDIGVPAPEKISDDADVGGSDQSTDQ